MSQQTVRRKMTKEERIELTKRVIKDFKVYRVISEIDIVEMTLDDIIEMGYGHLMFCEDRVLPDGGYRPGSFAVCISGDTEPLIVIHKNDYGNQVTFNHELHHALRIFAYDFSTDEVVLESQKQAEIDADNYALSKPHKREDAERFLDMLRTVLAGIDDDAEPGIRAMFEARVANFEKRLADM